MQSLSVVIVCKNEAEIISKLLQSLEGLTDDVVIYDTGSTDNTLQIVKQYPVSVRQGPWEGFGKTKQKSTSLAKYDWVLCLDADEAIDEELKKSLQSLQLNNDKIVYTIRYKNFFGDKHLKYGEWGNDKHIRLFNRTKVNWDDAPVHEQLVIPAGTRTIKLPGYILHRTVKDLQDYAAKTVSYALITAEKYHRKGKRAFWYKQRLAPGFNFFMYYFIRLGFLDGREGYICAKMTAHYTFLKYTRLKELEQQELK